MRECGIHQIVIDFSLTEIQVQIGYSTFDISCVEDLHRDSESVLSPDCPGASVHIFNPQTPYQNGTAESGNS